MLPREQRLDRSSFAAVNQGKRAISAHFSVTWAASEEGRAAVVVSKKVAKKAVDRHTLKRRILEAVRSQVAPGRSFVVYARGGSPTLSYAALAAELRALLTNLPKV